MISSYRALLHRLFQVNLLSGMKLGLQNALDLQRYLDFPDKKFLTIHVAGTNGKGSVATKIAYTLQLAGYRVGLYTSPHLACFRERIRINGKMISEKAVEFYLNFLFELVEKKQLKATFFELTTFLAFNYFAAEQVDIAVIETGLGGRLDATNVITPCLCVITSISLDHTDLLGFSKEQIAKEKGGIIKPCVPIITGPSVPEAVIAEMAKNQNAPYLPLKIPSSFCFEKENCQIAQAALLLIKKRFNLTNSCIKKGVTEGKQPCRFEIFKEDSSIILDVAHNPDGLAHLFQAIESYAPHRPLRLLFGLSKNKDIKGCLNLMAAYGQDFYVVQASNGRGVPVQKLMEQLQQLGVNSSCLQGFSSVTQAVQQARHEAKKKDQLLVICGSFFIMAEVRQALGYQEERDFLDLN